MKRDLDRLIASGKVQAIGMAWFDEADYPAILHIMADAAQLPRTHAQWHQRATQGEKELATKGVKVIRAVIDPQHFPGWCAARGLNVDAQARTRFASEQAARDVGL